MKKYKLYLLDMDGTIYLGNNLFPETPPFLKFVKDSGARYMFLTNNSSKSADSYVEKLARLGIDATVDDFLTSTYATVLYLNNNFSGKKIYALGTASFKEELRRGGLDITDTLSDGIDCLVMGFDTELTFKKLEDACILLGRGVDFIATNPDYVCPTEWGYVPDCGSVSDMLYNATRRRPKFIGKPEPTMVELALAANGLEAKDALLVGDRIYTDIASGYNAGIDTALVLSGEATLEDLEKSEIKPTYVLENIKGCIV